MMNAAAIPGVLYFVAVGVMVHFEAARQGLPVLERSGLPNLLVVLRRNAHLLLGPALLVWFLVGGRSPLFAGFWALVAAVVASQVRPDTRIGWRQAVDVLVGSAGSALPVALACATVGIVVGVVSTTGLPTSATYIITSIMAAPALIQLGVPKLVAHMFVFYFGILADLTPPTAISTYATSSIAGADVWRTQWLAMLLALSGFVIPFSFAYDPAMLLIGAGPVGVVLRTAAATLGIVMLGAGLIEYFRSATRPWERGALLLGAFLLIFPGAISDLIGVGCFVAVVVSQRTGKPLTATQIG